MEQHCTEYSLLVKTKINARQEDEDTFIELSHMKENGFLKQSDMIYDIVTHIIKDRSLQNKSTSLTFPCRIYII